MEDVEEKADLVCGRSLSGSFGKARNGLSCVEGQEGGGPLGDGFRRWIRRFEEPSAKQLPFNFMSDICDILVVS